MKRLINTALVLIASLILTSGGGKKDIFYRRLKRDVYQTYLDELKELMTKGLPSKQKI